MVYVQQIILIQKPIILDDDNITLLHYSMHNNIVHVQYKIVICINLSSKPTFIYNNIMNDDKQYIKCCDYNDPYNIYKQKHMYINHIG